MSDKKKPDEDVEQLLNLKIDSLGELDLEDDDTSNPEASQEVEEKPLDVRAMQDLPRGKEGLKQILESPSVKKLDEQLAGDYSDKPTGDPFQATLKQIHPKERTEQYKTGLQNDFSSSTESVEQLYKTVLSGERIRHAEIMRIVESYLNIFPTDQCILLNFSNYEPDGKDYLFYHVLKVSLLSMNLASTLGYSKRQVTEVGVAGLLADVGMILVPEEIRFKPSVINKQDYFDIQKHPVTGIHVVEKISGIPGPVAYVAYQHHERCGGTGYPKGRKDRLIHNYAKIVSIADVYVALNSQRSYRKGLKAYDAMVKILHMAKAGQLDREFVKKFVSLVSLFPIGSIVKLSTGDVAKVVQSTGHVDKPSVSLLKDGGEKVVLDLSRESDVKIVEPLPKTAVANAQLMDGF